MMGGKADWVLRAEEDGLGEKGKPSGGSSSRGARPRPGDGDDESRRGQISGLPKATLKLVLAPYGDQRMHWCPWRDRVSGSRMPCTI